MAINIHNFINNIYLPTESQIESTNPNNNELLCTIPNSGRNEAQMAVNAAKQAFKSWSLTTVAYRANLLNKIADELEKRLEEFAIAESKDQGKPLSLSLGIEVPRAVYNFRFFAAAILNHKNESTENFQAKLVSYTTQIPGGVALLISPWNLPLYLLTWKIAPCIAAGLLLLLLLENLFLLFFFNILLLFVTLKDALVFVNQASLLH